MLEQLEFANTIVLNKEDLLLDRDLEVVGALEKAVVSVTIENKKENNSSECDSDGPTTDSSDRLNSKSNYLSGSLQSKKTLLENLVSPIWARFWAPIGSISRPRKCPPAGSRNCR